MIDLARLRSVRIVVAHENSPTLPCPDGVASAILVADALRPHGAEFVFVQHGTQKFLELPAKTGMLFVDIAPPEHRAAQFLECGAIVLDHHKSARAVVERFVDVGLGAFADEDRDIGVSGALLAYRHVWRPLHEPDVDQHAAYRIGHAHAFAALAGVRDTWQRNDARWRQACAQAEALRFWPWHNWPSDPFGVDFARMQSMLAIGDVLVERRASEARRLIAQGERVSSNRGTRILIIPSRDTSDVADMIGDEVDLVVGFEFMFDGRPKMIVSTRSRGTFDCRLFCEANRGGGHARAAGCEVKIDGIVHDVPSPFSVVRAMVDVFERTGQGIADPE